MCKQTLFGLMIALLSAGEPPVRADDPPGPEGTKTAEAPAGLLEALKDNDPSVRLQAAQALIQRGQAKAALPVVEELVKSPQQGIRLEASLLLKQLQSVQLEAKLKDPNPSARLAAAQALWQRGGAEATSAIPVLVELLNSARHELRFPAALTLTQRNVPEAKAAVAVLVQALQHSEARVRFQAAKRLQQIGTAEARAAAPALVALLREHQRELGFQPATLLGQMRPADLRAAGPALREALNDGNPSIRFQAALILIRIDRAESQAAIPVLIDFMVADQKPPGLPEPSLRMPGVPRHDNAGFRLPAIQALAKIGPDARAAIPPLVKLLDDAQAASVAALTLPQLGLEALQPVLETWAKQESFNRPGVIEALGGFGPKAEPAVPKLMQALASQDARVQGLAATALRQIGTEAVPSLEKALAKPDARLRQAAAAILGDIGPAAESAIPALTGALQDPDIPVRVQAAQALWEVAHEADKVIPNLLAELREKDVSRRRSSAQLLAEMGPLPESIVPALRAVLNDSDPIVRISVATSLCGVPGHRKEAIPVLGPALKKRGLRLQAVEALGKAGPEAKEAIPLLLGELRDDTTDYEFAGRIGFAVGQIAGSEGAEALLRTLASSPKRFRPLVAQALGQAGTAGLAALVKLLDDEDSVVGLVAVRSLGQAGRRSAEMVSALVKGLQDRNAQVRLDALRVMEEFVRDASSVASASRAVPVLTRILKGGPAEERIFAAEPLAYLEPCGEQAVSVLVEAARDGSLGLRRQAIAALGRIAELRAPPSLLSEKVAVPTLAQALDSPDATLRVEAALALAQVGTAQARRVERNPPSAEPQGQSGPPFTLRAPLAQQVLSVLLEVARERNHPLRTRALDALALCGAGDEAVVSTLTQALGEDGPARVKAAEVLGRLGPLAKATVPALTDLVKGPDPEARIQGALALWRIDNRAEVVPVLVRELKNTVHRRPPNASLLGRLALAASALPVPPCQQAAEALGEIGPAARAAVPALTKVLSDPRLSFYRFYYAHALARIDPQAAGVAVPTLREVLEGKPNAVPFAEAAATAFRRQAAKTLGEIGAPAREAAPSLRSRRGLEKRWWVTRSWIAASHSPSVKLRPNRFERNLRIAKRNEPADINPIRTRC